MHRSTDQTIYIVEMTGTLVISALHWVDGVPRLRVRAASDQHSELVDLIGLQLNYRADADSARVCIGHKPFRRSDRDWFDCDRPALPDGLTCDRCAASDATFASQLHHAHTKAGGELDASVVAHLDQPNDLYLAGFRDGSIKVGTSTVGGIERRLSEQGAWKAMIVAKAADGRAVRVLEDRVSEVIGLPQAVSIKRKLAGLVAPVPDDRIDSELKLWTGQVHDLVESMGESALEPVSTDWSFPASGDAVWDRLHPYPLKLSSGFHDISVVAACGRAIVVTRPGGTDRFVADVRQLFGIRLDLGDHQPDELTIQDALF